MSGILFLKTERLADLREFYTNGAGCDVWLDQNDCVIFKHGNFLFGFCQREVVENQAMLTFFYESKDEVDRMYRRMEKTAVAPPALNEKYDIYQFFAHDPEGRMVEFQYFNQPTCGHLTGEELLLSRRSVREFSDRQISDAVLTAVMNLSRYAPTSHNRQGYYFKIVRDRKLIDWLSETRGRHTAPIGRANTAVAICSDPAMSQRHIQDGCIAAYHFMLSAWSRGLGTCWIAAMDRDDVKETLDIPGDHYVVTVTPLGYPKQRHIDCPERKPLADFIKE